jgi:DNA-binding transcriptional regulator YhcF (GntR family)
MRSALDESRPIYLQIKEGIEQDILNGRLAPEEQIPSNSQLVSFYNVNPLTVLKGVSLLADEGIVYKKRGLGMFVEPDAPQILRERFRMSFEQEQIRPLVMLAKPLGISLEDIHKMIDVIWEENTL